MNSKRGSALEPLLHSTQDITIEKLVVGGDGLGRIEFNGKPVVVFVPRAAPGDQLKVRINKAEKNHLNGEILEILKPSPQRQEAHCEYFKNCGGCSWQHITEDEQVRQKEQILQDLLKKFIPDVNYELKPTIRGQNTLHYRNRIQLKHLGNQLGYFKRGSHQIVDIESCPLAEKEISEKISQIKSSLKNSPDLTKYELRINQLNEFEYYPIGEDGEGLSFSQVNREINLRLVDEASHLIREASPTFITELYAGAGNFTFSISNQLSQARIEAVEMNPKLTRFAVQNLQQKKLQSRLSFFTSDCESFVKRRQLSSEFILLDPPRAGCSEIVLNKILAASAKHLLYISCHPVFLARDLQKIFKLQPSYKISEIRIFDMFPQTDHFETLVLLTK